jgi:hypothetical protein
LALFKPGLERLKNQAMLVAVCHCGAVKLTVPQSPRSLTSCDCSICRRYGTLWAYYKAANVRVAAKPEALDKYMWGRKIRRFVRCSHCGTVMYYEYASPRREKRIAVNARNFEPSILGTIPVRNVDGGAPRPKWY